MDIDTHLEDTNLFPPRINNALGRAGMYTIKDLVSKTRQNIKEIRGIGKDSFEDIIHKIHTLGFLFRDEVWKQKTTDKEVLDISVEEIGLSERAIHFLKKQNGIYNIFDFIQIQKGFFSLESLSKYHTLPQKTRNEIIKKREELEEISFTIYKDRLEEEVGKLSLLSEPISCILPTEISSIIIKTSNIRSIRELLQLLNDYTSFQRFRGLKKEESINIYMYEQIVNMVHQEGLLFADERLRLRLKKEKSKEEIKKLFLSEIMLPSRDIRILSFASIYIVEDLCNLSLSPKVEGAKCLFGIRDIGNRTNIINKIHELGLHFQGEKPKEVDKERIAQEEKKVLEYYEFLLIRRMQLQKEAKELDEEIQKCKEKLNAVTEVGKSYVKK